MKVTKEMRLRDFEFWSGAKSNAEILTDRHFDELEFILEDLYPDGMDETQINDLFWFDFDSVIEWLGIEVEDDEDEIEEDE